MKHVEMSVNSKEWKYWRFTQNDKASTMIYTLTEKEGRRIYYQKPNTTRVYRKPASARPA